MIKTILAITVVFVAGTTIYVLDSDNSYVYEVTARWLHHGCESFISYAFWMAGVSE